MTTLCCTAISAETPPSLADYVSPRDPAEDYLEAIDRIEIDHGPYAMELSDMYIGLGQTLFDAGEYWKARDAFHRGVMVLRVNLGPNSPEQTDHLFLLANIELMMGGPDRAGDILDSIYRVNAAHYGDDSAEMLPVLQRLYRWNLIVHPVGTTESDYLDYFKIVELTRRMSRASEKAYGPDDKRTALSYRRHGEAQFQLVRYLRGLKKRLNNLNDMAVSTTPFSRSFVSNVSAREHYRDGLIAFERYEEILQADGAVSPAEFAQALTEIGDWFLLVDESGKSEEYYRRSYEVLARDEGSSLLAAEHMSRPEPVLPFPGSRILIDSTDQERDEPPAPIEGLKLDVSMTVTDLGSVQRVEFLDPPDTLSEDQLRKIRLQVEKNPFRPAMKDGQLVTTREFVWQYEISTQEPALP